MGYPEEKCAKALKVAGGDIEQAVGFLLMGDRSQRGFDSSSEEAITSPARGGGNDQAYNAASVAGTTIDGTRLPILPPTMPTQEGESTLASRYLQQPPSAGAFTTENVELEDQLMNMGYGREKAKQALRVAQGDLEQAANFLLMGDSRSGFLLETESSPPPNVSCSSITANDAAVAAAIQQEDLFHHVRSTHYRDQSSFHPQLPPSNREGAPPMVYPVATDRPIAGPKPKIVATQTFLTTPGAAPFCTCVAASRFLMGGIASAPFLNNIMEVAIELYRKSSGGNTNGSDDYSIESVIKKYGRSHLSIQVVRNGGDDPMDGVFMPHDLQYDRGIRHLMMTCRNKQRAGWQIILLELKYDSFCACLPPKGTSNKFWFLDFLPRSNIRTPGAYALVHNSLLEMVESMESVFRTISMNQESEFVSFTLFRIKKLG